MYITIYTHTKICLQTRVNKARFLCPSIKIKKQKRIYQSSRGLLLKIVCRSHFEAVEQKYAMLLLIQNRKCRPWSYNVQHTFCCCLLREE